MALPITIQNLIDAYRKQEKTYINLHSKAYIEDKSSGEIIRIPYGSIVNKYKDYLAGAIVRVELTIEEQNYYRYKPRLLAKDLYGTAELWFVILELNYLCSVSEFRDISSIRVYSPSILSNMLNEIMVMEGII